MRRASEEPIAENDVPFPGDVITPDDPRYQEAKQRKKQSKANGLAAARSSMHYEWEPLDTNQAYLVKKRLARLGVGALIGRGYTGKTETVIDLVAALITERSWGGARITRQGGVVFFNAEGGKGPMRSWHAVKELVIKPQFEHEGSVMPPEFPFVLVSDTKPLLKNKAPNPEAIKWYIERIEEAKAVFQKKFGVETVLAVFETLAKIAVWKDENDNAECTNAFIALEQISRATDLFCLATDHLPKDEAATKPRGGGAKYDAADSILRISVGDGPARTLHVDKVRGDEGGAEIPFNLLKVVRGVDHDGDPITSVRIAWLDERSYDPRKTKKGRPSTHPKMVKQAFIDACNDGFGEKKFIPKRGEILVVNQQIVRRNYFDAAGWADDNKKNLSDKFRKAISTLIAAGDIDAHTVENEGTFLWDPRWRQNASKGVENDFDASP